MCSTTTPSAAANTQEEAVQGQGRGPIVDSNNDYRRSLISSLGAAAARRSASSNPGNANGAFPVSASAPSRENEETNKKSKSLISSSLGFSSTGHRSRQQRQNTSGNGKANTAADRSSSISGSTGSISKSAVSTAGSGGSLAGKISRGIIQEFASSSERLMSWKAKLKKTKLDTAPTTGPGQEEPEEEEEDNDDDRPQAITENSDVFERQTLADLTAKSDPLPRAPKYIYKTNSMDSNYDMAMGAYEISDGASEHVGGGQHQQQQLWVMGQRRPQPGMLIGGRPDGFYVGLTLVNTGALETEAVMAPAGGIPDAGGAYFSNNGKYSYEYGFSMSFVPE